MADENTAAGAPASDTTPTLSIDDAVAVLDGGEEKRERVGDRPRGPDGKFLPEKASPDGDDAETTDEPADEAEPSDQDETPAEGDEPDAEPETDEEPEEIVVPGNAKTRLRTGELVAVADLKKAYDELQETKRQGPEISKQREEVEKVKAEVQQRQKYLDEVLPHAFSVLEKAIPPEPDPSLREADPIEYFTQKDRRDRAIADLQSLDNARRVQAAEQQKAQAEEFDSYVAEQRKKLVARKSELADPDKAKAFYGEFVKVGEAMGLTEKDMDSVHDHRVILGVMSLAEKAAKWDKLQAAKPKVVEKAKDAVPVKTPGRRPDPSERRGSEIEGSWKRLDQTGSVDDAVALIGKLNL